MKLPLAYLCVVFVWSTTPLGIVWSSETVSPTLAVLMRMALAALLGTLVLLVSRIKMPFSAAAIKLYSYSAFGVFGGMMCGYLAARSVSSGIMSLIFGLSPVVSGLLAQKILHEPKFSPVRLLAFFIALLGLGIVCWDNFSLSDGAAVGIPLVICAMLFFSLSGVLVKTVVISIHPLATTLGALYFSLPCFAAAWLLVGGDLEPAQWGIKSLASIVYLGIVGSLIGFICYFFVLQRLSASTVSLITLITPVFAISLGAGLNNEHVSMNLIIGASCIMSGLSLYFWGEKWLLKRRLTKAST